MTNEWHRYPFRLVADDRALDFPAAEGEHPDQESDTWFTAGELTGTTGRSFAFLTGFDKTVRAEQSSPTSTPWRYRLRQRRRYQSSAGPVAWTTCRDDDGELRPYTYRVSLLGVDQAGQSMELDLTVTPTRAPVPVGADAHNGKITCFGQHSARHLLVFPDRDGGDRTAALGRAERTDHRQRRPRRPAVVSQVRRRRRERGEIRGPFPMSGARSTWTTASI